jgi:xylose dehydrogenase (NAD/NADP)
MLPPTNFKDTTMPEFSPVRYGVLGAANIARSFASGLAGSKVATVASVASRSADKAAAFAREMGIPRSHGSYDALLADPEIDAIYNPLPNDLHAEWTIKAAAAGKHVLCEKPLSVGAADAQAMFDAGRRYGVHVVEAYPYMSQPQTLRVRALLAEGAIGKIQLVTASFGFRLVTQDGAALGDPANIRLDPARAGGGLRDAGTYAMSFVRLAMGARPVRAMATARWTQSGVDQTIAATIEFDGGAIAQITSTMASAAHRHAVVIGDAGVIETSFSNHAPDSGILSLRIKRGAAGTVPFDTEELPGGDGFRAEGESFARMIRLGASAWNGATEAESLDTARALTAILASARADGGWVKV